MVEMPFLLSGVAVYFSEHMVPSGAVFDEHIREELLRSEEVWLLLTSESIRSEWVTTEWAVAWAPARPFPILLRCTEKDLSLRLKVR